jgi:hypothetical protein
MGCDKAFIRYLSNVAGLSPIIGINKRMKALLTTLTHEEISVLLFALQGGRAAPMPDAETCEDACPVVESVEELLCGGQLDPKQQLVRHLNNHLREAMIESGMFELMASAQRIDSLQVGMNDPTRLREVNRRLTSWSCQIGLDEGERQVLYESLLRLPRSSWVTMPRTMWRLRKKLKG